MLCPVPLTKSKKSLVPPCKRNFENTEKKVRFVILILQTTFSTNFKILCDKGLLKALVKLMLLNVQMDKDL